MPVMKRIVGAWAEVEGGVEVEVEVESGPSEASLKRLKKAELMELAMLQGLDSSGTKADIIARLLS